MAVTQKDKQWISERFAELEKKLERLETRFADELRRPMSPNQLRRETRSAVLRVIRADLGLK